jgi:hypothetical protein
MNRLLASIMWAAGIATLAAGIGLFTPSIADAAGDPTVAAEPTWPPKGISSRLPVTADTWLGCEGEEAKGGAGGAEKFKIKSRKEYALFDVDASSLKGKIVTGALWHFHPTSAVATAESSPALRVSVSTVAAPWVEGTATNFEPQAGSATYASPAQGKADWAYPGSTLMDAALGRGHTIWYFADATAPDEAGWQSVAVDPDVVAARVAGLSHGFMVNDDVGCTWSYIDGKFDYQLYPNHYIHSRESKKFVPYLEVWTDGEDNQAPEAIQDVAVKTDGFPAGQALVTWKTPADRGGGKTLGFNVTYTAGEKTAAMPRYLVPMAGKVGAVVRMHIQDLPLAAGQEIMLCIAPVDSAGNVGEAFSRKVKLSATPAVFPIAEADLKPFEPSTDLPEVGGLKVAVLDMLDKVEARTGKMLPDHPAGYKGGNHLWSAKQKLIRLQAARNEAVCFQVNLEGTSAGAAVKFAFEDGAAVEASVHRFDYVQVTAGGRRPRARTAAPARDAATAPAPVEPVAEYMPDVVVPLTGPLPIPAKDDPEAAAQTNASLLCEVYVPHKTAPGVKKGTLTITSAGQTLQVKVDLSVWDFTLPNQLSFVPEMNDYSAGGPTDKTVGFYKLAHEHRTCLTRLYYHWNGRVDYEPKVQDEKVDWTEWSSQFGPLFDGTAFKDLPRSGEPLDVFYLPFNENWPLDYYKYYQKAYWPENAFPQEYKTKMQQAFVDLAKMADGKGWHNTTFWFFLNGKVYNKRDGWNKGISTWVMDEPRDLQDFWALRWYGILFHQAVDPVKGKARMWVRSDVSYSPWGRNTLWGVVDTECLGGGDAQRIRMKQDEQVLWGKSAFTQYGAANHPSEPNVQPVVWSLLCWSNGAGGLAAWRAIARVEEWSKGSATALLYPQKDGSIVPSVRLKAFRQGQQMIEYLTLLGEAYNQPRFAVAGGMKQAVNLASAVRKSYEDDAGTARFEKADPTTLWMLRYRVGQMVSAKHPAYQRCIKPVITPDSGVDHLPDIGYVRVGPKVTPGKPG